MCATLFTKNAILSVTVNLQVKFIQKLFQIVSSQSQTGIITGNIIFKRANNGIYNLKYTKNIRNVINGYDLTVLCYTYVFCHITMGSASKSDISITFRFFTTSGCGVNTSHPT